MTKKIVGLLASVALMGAGTAFAQQPSTPSQQQQQQTSPGSSAQTGDTQDSVDNQPSMQDDRQPATGGAGTQAGTTQGSASGTSASATASSAHASELTGRVLKVQGKLVTVEHMGAAVPLKLTSATRFDDPKVKRASDLKEGQEIRASFELKKTDNVATRISLAESATGGAGEAEQAPGTGGSGTGSETGTPPITEPGMEGTGGSGSTTGQQPANEPGTLNPDDSINQGSQPGEGSGTSEGTGGSGEAPQPDGR